MGSIHFINLLVIGPSPHQIISFCFLFLYFSFLYLSFFGEWLHQWISGLYFFLFFVDTVFLRFFIFLARTPTGIFGLRRAVEHESLKHEVAHQSTHDHRKATMSVNENASDGSGTSSDHNSSNSGDCGEITSAFTTPPADLRNSMLPAKVERMMFLRLNRLYICLLYTSDAADE